MPKGFIEIGGVPIVKRPIKKLTAAGVEEIVVGTGRCADWFGRHGGGARFAHNARYAETGGMGRSPVAPHS
ncbi:MAG: hypothetical protein LBK73_04110 [Treponema sp.]|jgi:2-aminoethylphosphonate-pyruvate transaminase|nr:hypothetical protein [Treponema sp.]